MKIEVVTTYCDICGKKIEPREKTYKHIEPFTLNTGWGIRGEIEDICKSCNDKIIQCIMDLSSDKNRF
jgi:hypothetical protein